MRTLRKYVSGSIHSIGGSISRPREKLYREAADIAYHFHWPKNEIFVMTGKERKQWLSEINRIHEAEYRQRKKELIEQVHQITEYRNREKEDIQW